MSETIRIAVDAMGGDYAPGECVAGALLALEREKDISLVLVGDESLIRESLRQGVEEEGRLGIVHAPQVIGMDEHPAYAIKKKKDSSIAVAQRLVREGKADAFVSAGSTGAVLVGGQILIGRIKGVERPALAPLIPNLEGFSLLLDCGANVDAKPSNLLQFARMGSIYMRDHIGTPNPRVAILNIGTEENKGNALVRDTYPLLREADDINFIGSIEARDVPYGGADVIVCDAFAGNVALKMFEGTATALLKLLKETLGSSLKTKLGTVLIYKDLKERLKSFDSSEYGGAPMLGLKHVVVKAHGNSKREEIAVAISQTASFIRHDISGKIAQAFAGKAEGFDDAQE